MYLPAAKYPKNRLSKGPAAVNAFASTFRPAKYVRSVRVTLVVNTRSHAGDNEHRLQPTILLFFLTLSWKFLCEILAGAAGRVALWRAGSLGVADRSIGQLAVPLPVVAFATSRWRCSGKCKYTTLVSRLITAELGQVRPEWEAELGPVRAEQVGA